MIDEGEEGEEHGQQRHHDQQDDGEAAVWQQDWMQMSNMNIEHHFIFITSKSTHDASSLCSWTSSTLSYTHLSPGVSLIYDLAYDSGMLQSELFTSRSQNLVLAKLPSSGFWKYGHFFK